MRHGRASGKGMEESGKRTDECSTRVLGGVARRGLRAWLDSATGVARRRAASPLEALRFVHVSQHQDAPQFRAAGDGE